MAQISTTQPSDWIGSCLIANHDPLNLYSSQGVDNFGGQISAPYILKQPPKMDPFVDFPIRLVEMSQYLSPSKEIIKKNYITFEFCDGTGTSWSEITPHLKICRVPHWNSITTSSWANMAVFLFFFVWGTVSIERRCNVSLWDCCLDTEVKSYVSLFENSSRGLSAAAVFLGVWSAVA